MKSPFQYCPDCGASDPCFRGDKEVLCSRCGFRYFHNVAAAVGVFIRCGDDYLFAVRGREPDCGKLDLPGGFSEPGESLEQGLTREIQEELGLALPAPRYLFSFPNIYLFEGVSYCTVDALFEVAYREKPVVVPADDVADIRWLALADIEPAQIAFSSIRKAIARLRHKPSA